MPLGMQGERSEEGRGTSFQLLPLQRRSGRREHSRWKEWQAQRQRIKDVEAGKACEPGWDRVLGPPGIAQ